MATGSTRAYAAKCRARAPVGRPVGAAPLGWVHRIGLRAVIVGVVVIGGGHLFAGLRLAVVFGWVGERASERDRLAFGCQKKSGMHSGANKGNRRGSRRLVRQFVPLPLAPVR